MFFSQSTDNGTTTIVDQITGREYAYSDANAQAKRAARESAVENQQAALLKLQAVTSQSYYTVAELAAAFDRVA